MPIEAVTYVRKPFYIEAVQVTDENIVDVAVWCNGGVFTGSKNSGEPEQKYIKVRVNKPMNPRQTRAFVGDWVLYAQKGYKVYTPAAFANNFSPVVPQPETSAK